MASPPRKDDDNFSESVNKLFVAACKDYKPQDKANNDEGVWRVAARVFLVVAVVAGILVVALGRFINAPQLHPTRIERKDFTSAEGQKYFTLSADGQVDGLRKLDVAKESDITCPCRNRTLTWSRFTEFYTFDAGTPINAQTISVHPNTSAFCDFFTARYDQTATSTGAPVFQDFFLACTARVGYLIGPGREAQSPDDSAADCLRQMNARGTGAYASREAFPPSCNVLFQQVDSPLLVNSQALNLTVTQRMFDSFYSEPFTRETDVRYQLASFPLANASYDAVAGLVLSALFWSILSGGHLEQVTTGYNIANYGPGSLAAYFGTDVRVGMQFIWSNYFLDCNPPYCDVLKVYSAPRKSYEVAVGLGGILSLATFALQTLLWPIFTRTIFKEIA